MKTDKDLLEAIGQKNADAFHLFYLRHSRFIFRRIKTLIRDEDTANDFIQKFWLNLWEKPAMLKTNDKGSTLNFLYRFLFTFVLLMKRLYFKHEDRIVRFEEWNRAPDSFQYSHVLEEVEMNELLEFIEAITEDFTSSDQQIYRLYSQNYSHARIADELSLSEGTVRNRLTNIFKVIRSGIKNRYMETYPKIPAD